MRSALALRATEGFAQTRNKAGLRPYDLALGARNYLFLNYLRDVRYRALHPPLLPVLANAAVVCVAFLGLHARGWLGGAACWILCALLAKRLDQATIDAKGSRPVLGSVLGLVLSLVSAFFLLHAPSRPSLLAWCALMALLMALALAMATRTPACTPPPQTRCLHCYS